MYYDNCTWQKDKLTDLDYLTKEIKEGNRLGELLGSSILFEESYIPFHEVGHLGVGKITKLLGFDSKVDPAHSNFGDTYIVEILEKEGFLPNNDSFPDFNNDGIADFYKYYADYIQKLDGQEQYHPLGYAYAYSDDPTIQKTILAGGHLGVFSIAGLLGYFGRKFKNIPMKFYSSLMSIAPTLTGVKDLLTENAHSDFYRLAELTGTSPEYLVGLSALGSLALLGYIWRPEIKEIFSKNKVDKKNTTIDKYLYDDTYSLT
jgi:hypothetical protein